MSTETKEMLSCNVIFVFDYMTISTHIEVAEGNDYRDRAIKEAEEFIKGHYGLNFNDLGLTDVEVDA